MQGENTTDELRREAYLAAKKAIMEVENAKASMDKFVAIYRNVLKGYAKQGVSTAAIAYALKVRNQDEDELFIEEREKLRMLDLAGVVPNIKEKLMDRLDVEEPTSHEDNMLALAKAEDLGARTGRSGISKDANPYMPGTQLFVQWVQGWMAGQRAIADEMEQNSLGSGEPVQPPEKGRPGRPVGSKNRPKLADDTEAARADLETEEMFEDAEPPE